MNRSRTVRIFLSSTFRDFGEERDLLVRKVFPALRTRLKDRFVELVDVDLRWGITVEEAERGDVLPICLAEIDRSRPYFIGMLGERYGWIPPLEDYAPDLLERQPWLKKHRGGKSVTELEILHGVLKNKRMKSRAFFYFRSPAYAHSKGGRYVPDSTEDRQRQLDLKRRIKDGGYSVTSYSNPEALAKRMEQDLWKLLDAEFPSAESPDAFERECMRHEAYAAPRRRLYLGGDAYIKRLDALLKKNASRILITGQSGGGKSAMLANAIAKHRCSKTHVLVHYLGSSSDAADAVALVRRVIDYIRRVTGNTDQVAVKSKELFKSVPAWLAIASAFSQKHRTRWIFVFDALNNLHGHKDLQWFPVYLPEHIQIVVSCLEGDVKEALETKGAWDFLFVEPLDPKGQRQLLTEYLKRFNKSLPADLLNQVLGHSLANNPLWLKTLAEELRLFGSHQELSARLNTLLGPPKGKFKNEPPTVDDLFEHVLKRIEEDLGRALVRDALAAIWASRAGLNEAELLEILAPHLIKMGRAKKKENKLPPAHWAPVRNALDEMLLESGGRIVFGHDYVRVAVRDRYLPSESLQRNAHKRLAEHFAQRKVDERVAEELPHQWREAGAWKQLEQTLTSLEMFEVLRSHRKNEEHLGYWLSLEAIKGQQLIATRLKNAFSRWNLPSNQLKTAHFAGDLERFLSYSGRGVNGSFTVSLARLALAVTEKLKGKHHFETGQRVNNLGYLLRAKADLDGAESLFKRALSIAEKKLAPGHLATATILDNLASTLKDKGDYKGAEPLFRRALVIAEKTGGTDHLLTGRVLNNLALLLKVKGDIEGAKSLLVRSLEIIERSQGTGHPDTATCLRNLGDLFNSNGSYEVAEKFLRRSLAISEKVQGPDHPSTGVSVTNLGITLKDKGDYESAEPLLRRGLAIAENFEGSDHPSTGDSLNALGVLLYLKADYEGAEPFFRRAISVAEKNYESKSNETGIRITNLANTLSAKGDYDGAEFLLRRALAIIEKSQGSEDKATGTSLHYLGMILNIKGDYENAEPLLRRSLAISQKENGAVHSDLVARLDELVYCLNASGSYDRAVPLIRNVLTIVKKNDGEKSKSAAEKYRQLGVTLRRASRYKESSDAFQVALEIFESINTRKSAEVALVLNGMGQLEAIQGNFLEAEKLLAEALGISRESSPDIVEEIEKHLAGARTGKSI
jgi:nephrocystin-3